MTCARVIFKKLTVVFAIAFASAAPLANAAGVIKFSKITIVDVRANGTFLISFDTTVAGSALCASANNLSRMTGDASTAGGKAILTTALAAYLSGAQVLYAEGSGSCNQDPGIESIVILKLGQ